MKKTLIALAVAASAAVSGSAMAWTANGTGGSVDLGGTLTPADVITPWEVKVGAAVNSLDADIRKGDTKVSIPVKKAIPVLGIRTVEVGKTFQGQPGISPQISYGNAVDVNAFENGRVPLTLEVKNAGDVKIGTLTSTFASGSEASWSNHDSSGKFNVFAAKPGDGFFGGLAKSADKISDSSWAIAASILDEFVANYNDQNAPLENNKTEDFTKNSVKYSSFYGSGIQAGEEIKITLDQPAASDAIAWKASLPVTVSYQ
ncbi:fimbrial protein [Escherichia ruysiae]|uniref:F4 family fimbrial subunit n=2 Tax=Escherichia ruysiae TaxID=2608867 RepID=UPI002E1C93AC|nr:fimbrial protein [Escherichia ruysiae]MEC9888942.1 fimbrial protein [Escherichia ruysiae]MED9042743.1 fimbrial protein [Escherichia ruysiae]